MSKSVATNISSQRGYGTYAARPASAPTGQRYICSDTNDSEWLYDGSKWVRYLSGVIVDPTGLPAASSFTWINQGTATLVDSFGGLLLTAPGATGSNSRQLALQTPPATPYNLTVGFLVTASNFSTSVFGLGMRESSTAKILEFGGYISGGSGYARMQYTKATAFNGSFSAINAGDDIGSSNNSFNSRLFFLRLRDDGTNIISYFSTNNEQFEYYDTCLRTNPFTSAPNQIGICTQTIDTNTNHAVYAKIVSWIYS